MVQVTGKLRISQWETPEGEKRSRVYINADDIQLKVRSRLTTPGRGRSERAALNRVG